jgi:CheY-like chemotaxis protein
VGTNSKRILLVEDHADTREMVVKFLRRSGYIVSAADGHAHALQLCEGESFDLLIGDIQLEDGSGLDLMRELAAKCKIKGIAYTGYGREQDIARARDAGFVAHVLKPAEFSVLLETIERVLAGDPAS